MKAAQVQRLPSHAEGIAAMFGVAASGLSNDKPSSALAPVNELPGLSCREKVTVVTGVSIERPASIDTAS